MKRLLTFVLIALFFSLNSCKDKANTIDECGCKEDGEKTGGSAADPHLATADVFYYDFRGFGEFIALKSTVDNFEIQVRQEGWAGSEYCSVNSAIAIQTGTDIVSIHVNPFTVYVNDKQIPKVSSKVSLSEGAYIEPYKGSTNMLTVGTSNGDKIRVRASAIIDYELYLNSNRQGKVEGLLGNFDGEKTNDLWIRGGAQITNTWNELYPNFANSWRVRSNFLIHYDTGKNTASYTRLDLPKKRPEASASDIMIATQTCKSAGLTEEPYLSNCIYDYALTKDMNFVTSAFDAQQNRNTLGYDQISTFNDVVLTASNEQGTLTDSCLVSFTTGEVFQLKDGAKNAAKIDGILYFYCDLSFSPPSNIIYCAGSCGVGKLNSAIVSQKWPVYRTGQTEQKFGSDADDPYNKNNLATTEWVNIRNATDLSVQRLNLNKDLDKDNYQFGSRIGYDSNGGIDGFCRPDKYSSQTLYRFITQEGKRGVFKLKSMTSTTTGWRIVMDIKVQK